MATGTILNQFIVVKKTLTNQQVNGVNSNWNAADWSLGGSYIDITSDVPSGYIPVVGSLKATATSGIGSAVQNFPVGASWHVDNSTWIMRLINHNKSARTVSGTLYILCVKDPG